MNKFILQQKNGVTLIELLSVIVIFSIISLVLQIAVQSYQFYVKLYGTPLSAVIGLNVFVASLGIVVIVLWIILKILHFIFPSFPEYCEMGKCYLHSDCYHVIIDIVNNEMIFNEPVRSFHMKSTMDVMNKDGYIVYYKCKCGKEYLQYAFIFIAKINEQGELIPWLFNRPCMGWYIDRKAKLYKYNYSIPLNVLLQLRKENKDDSFIFRDRYDNLYLQCLSVSFSKRFE